MGQYRWRVASALRPGNTRSGWNDFGEGVMSPHEQAIFTLGVILIAGAIGYALGAGARK